MRYKNFCRKLFKTGMWNTVCAFHGLLPDSDLHSVWSDRDHILGVFLAEPQRDAGARRPRRHHRAHHDHTHVLHQRRPAQDLLCQIDRRLPGDLFRHGFRQFIR